MVRTKKYDKKSSKKKLSEFSMADRKGSVIIGNNTGKSLSEALLFGDWGEHVVYKNCSEYQKQFLYGTGSPQV